MPLLAPMVPFPVKVVTTPCGVMRSIAPFAVNQMLPSGPVVIAVPDASSGKLVTSPLVVTRETAKKPVAHNASSGPTVKAFGVKSAGRKNEKLGAAGSAAAPSGVRPSTGTNDATASATSPTRTRATLDKTTP